jgi:hypothetical protein
MLSPAPNPGLNTPAVAQSLTESAASADLNGKKTIAAAQMMDSADHPFAPSNW